MLDLEDLEPNLSRLVEQARDAMRDYFRKRSAEEAQSAVERWKTEKIYPYEGPPAGAVEEVERQVFDVVALNVSEYLPEFEGSDRRSKRFSLAMLRTAIEQSPGDIKRIIQEVLELPQDKREELVELVDRTSLTSIIGAARMVVNRLDFLAGLEAVLFEAEAKQKLKERAHLHRLLAENTWIFGEEFNLSVDDQSLNEVLVKHLELLRKDADAGREVHTLDGGRGIVDLMLSRKIPMPKGDQYEHLVVELKRPSKKIDSDVIQQVKKYAFAVAADERFRESSVKWVFWALSNEMDEIARKEASQSGRPAGLIYQSDDPAIFIWAKTWGQIIDESRGRLRFVQDRLNYMATHEDGLEHLRRVYARYLPPGVAVEKQQGADDVQDEAPVSDSETAGAAD